MMTLEPASANNVQTWILVGQQGALEAIRRLRRNLLALLLALSQGAMLCGVWAAPPSAPSNLAWPLARLWIESEEADAVAKATVGTNRQALSRSEDLLMFGTNGMVGVRIWTRQSAAALVSTLEELGLDPSHVSEPWRLIEGWLPARALADAATTTGVLSVAPMIRPVCCAGSAMTQGDAVHQSDRVRQTLGLDGTGIKVGVLSDSVDKVGGGLCDSVASGDLPGIVVSNGCEPGVEVLRDYAHFLDQTDEGRALLEIIHDIAPGAGLTFHSAMFGQLDYAHGIRSLAEHGCRVLVDDVMYLDEPFFQDGVIAEAVREMVQTRGVCYVTAAGNWHGRVHNAPFRDDGNRWHDFDPAAPVDTFQSLTVPAGTVARIILQWSDPWFTTNGVINDLDLHLLREDDGALLTSAATDNTATQQPIEILQWNGDPHAETRCHIRIRRKTGSGPVELKLLVQSGILNEYNDGPSVICHAMAEEAVSVGAVPWYRTETNEAFSSHGPAAIYFDAQGVPLRTPAARLKPELVGADAVNTSFFGADLAEDPDTQPNFAGTSAAAAHVAGIAALMLSANPALDPRQVKPILLSSATDLGPPGVDDTFGAGRVDALGAVRAALTTGDTDGPRVQMVSPPARTPRPVRFVQLQFNEAMALSLATNCASYELRGAGADGVFGTSDDLAGELTASYAAVSHNVRLDLLSPTHALMAGDYRVTARAVLCDTSGNRLEGGTNRVFAFSVTESGTPLPPLASDASVIQVAVNRSGRAAVAWKVDQAIGSDYYYLSLFDENGACVADRIGVSVCEETVDGLAVSINEAGEVAVAHNDYWQYGNVAIQVARFGPNGAFLGQTMVARWGENQHCAATLLPQGDLAVAWAEDAPGVANLQVFNRDGTAKTTVVRLSACADRPALASDAVGNFVAVWAQGITSATSLTNLVAQRFCPDGSPSGNSILLRANAGNRGLWWPDIAMCPNGEYLVTWNEDPSSGVDVLYGQCFNADGTAKGDAFVVAAPPQWTEAGSPRAAVAPSGQYVIAYWASGCTWARFYTACGVAAGAPIALIPQPSGASVGADGDGGFLFALPGPALCWFIPPQPTLDYGTALDTTNLAWTAGGQQPWYVQTFMTRDGMDAASSGALGNWQSSTLQTTVVGPGVLSAWWKVSSRTNQHFLRLLDNGEPLAAISGDVDWEQRSFSLAAGAHVLQWVYARNEFTPTGADAGWLDEVRYLPGGVPPGVVVQPASQTNLAGLAGALSVQAAGTTPLTYQWQFEGADLPGATNSVLTFSPVQPTHAGVYRVVVSNPYGTTHSADARLTVVGWGDAIEAANLVWTSASNVMWYVQTDLTHDGIDAVRSGPVGAGQSSALLTSVEGPGTLTFWWKVSSWSGQRFLRFYDNNVVAASISGEVDWEQPMFLLPAGTHILHWVYAHGYGLNVSGLDAGWLDEVCFIPGGTPPSVVIQPANQTSLAGTAGVLSVQAAGTAPFSYQWQFNGTDLPGATNSVLSLNPVQPTHAGVYRVAVTNPYGTTSSAPAVLTVVGWGDAVEAANLLWTSSGSTPWYVQTNLTHDGVDAVHSGPRPSTLQTTQAGPGLLTFWWKVSSKTNSHYLKLSVDGAVEASISGEVGWEQRTVLLTAGSHVLQWAYTPNNGFIPAGSDAAWLDQLAFIVPPVVAGQPASRTVPEAADALFLVTATGTPPLSFQWRREGQNLDDGGRISGSTTDALRISNAQSGDAAAYSVVICNAAGSAVSSNAVLIVDSTRPRLTSSSFADSDGTFQFVLRSFAGWGVEIETSENLLDWVHFLTITNVTGVFPVADTATNSNQRYYRARHLPH